MGMLQRLSLLIRSNINEAISRGENPEKVLNQLIIDMREQLARAKQEVAVAIADERKLRAQADDERKQSEDWENRAVLAVREGRDDLAKQALLRQQEHGERAVTLEETWRRQATETEKLKNSLRELNDKIEEAKRKKNLLVAKQKRAQAQRRIHETMAGLTDRSAFEAFERMAEKIEESERRALAAAEVQETLSGETIEKQFAQLEGADAVDRRLAALKERLGIPAATGGAAATPPRQLKAANVEEGAVKDAQLEEEA
ncbi:MAG: PspA/IM30 family protein [Gemmatimonadetes bacterium]|nr:PspA/IM30 family protein [Gemmatimonadota bacterium]